MPNEHPMMTREEYARRFPDEGEPRSVERLTDEELARHASRAYQLAAQHGEDQWIAVARMMRVQLSGDGTPPPVVAEQERLSAAFGPGWLKRVAAAIERDTAHWPAWRKGETMPPESPSTKGYRIAGEPVTDAVGEETSRLFAERDRLLNELAVLRGRAEPASWNRAAGQRELGGEGRMICDLCSTETRWPILAFVDRGAAIPDRLRTVPVFVCDSCEMGQFRYVVSSYGVIPTHLVEALRAALRDGPDKGEGERLTAALREMVRIADDGRKHPGGSSPWHAGEMAKIARAALRDGGQPDGGRLTEQGGAP